MLFRCLLFFLPLIFAAPVLVVEQSRKDVNAVDIGIEGLVESYEQCLESGLEVRYRYEVQLCKHRSTWFDGCGMTRVATRRISYDPISESYTIFEDLHGDALAPTSRNFKSLQEVLQVASAVEGLTFDYISAGDNDLMDASRAYISLRVSTDCHGSYNKTLARISSILTLGMVEYGGFDSDWMDFPLRDVIKR